MPDFGWVWSAAPDIRARSGVSGLALRGYASGGAVRLMPGPRGSRLSWKPPH